MKYEWSLLHAEDANAMTAAVAHAQTEGYEPHGELVVCPWTDHLPREQYSTDNDYCILFQWTKKEIEQEETKWADT